MFRSICSLLAILLLITGCSADDAPTRHNDFTPLTSIEIVAVAPAIAAHTSVRLAAIGNFSGQFSRDITGQVVWSSDAPAVAAFITAEKPELATGLAPGTANLTATVGSVSAGYRLTVTPATIISLAITPAEPSLPKGMTRQFALTGTFSDATVQDITFDAVWTSGDPAIATVSNAADSKGVAKALAAGTTTITTTFGGISARTTLTITEAALQSVTVSPASTTIVSQSRGSFRASGLYSDGSTADITDQAAWTTSSPEIAEITGSGKAKSIAPGTVSISASLNGISGRASIKVTGGVLTGITISPANPRLVKDTGTLITATGSFNNGSSREITGVVDWSLTNDSIASITTHDGNLAFLNAETTTAATIPVRIKAQSGQVSGETGLTVIAPQLRSITLSPPRLDLIAGTGGRFTLSALFSDGSSQDVSADTDWSSDAATIASIDNTAPDKGRVKGTTAGNTSISAAYGGFTVTAPVTVKSLTATDLTITGPMTATTGNQAVFSARATFIDGTTRDVTEDAVWSSDKPEVATLVNSVTRPGQVVAVDSGQAEITAEFGGNTESKALTVQ